MPWSKPLPLEPGTTQALHHAMDALLERDWQDGEDGIHPTGLLFSSPWKDWAARYPLLWLDSPATWDRLRRRDFRGLPRTVNRQHYPTCYLRNFHNQTDGYPSDYSAALYDLQVEILFNGAADPMRWRLLRPSTPVTLTVRGVSQLVAVKVRLAGDTLTAPLSPLLGVMVALPPDWVTSVTLQVSVPPSSVLTLVGSTFTPGPCRHPSRSPSRQQQR